MPTSNQVREIFLKYFERNRHKIVASSALIPFNDPTLLFTNAGMNQFKDVFLGNERRPYKRATTSQKCMRVSGKHNDFKDVGHSTRHHTFFEMLGNFSFGDYFKKDATAFAWELITKEYGLEKNRLWITIFQDDDEASEIWRKQVGVPTDRIVRLGEKDNFWAMGDTGPCGPCSEIHYDYGTSPLPNHPECDLTCSCGRWVEIWNLVFMQYNRDESGTMNPLPSPSIDTGMGFERITTILQGYSNNYETDLFRPLLAEISGIASLEYGVNPTDDISMRIIADHARAAAFLIGDGQYPGNDKRGYVLRKIMRRAVVHGKKLQVQEPFIYRVAGRVIELMQEPYPELAAQRENIARVILQEEQAFAETLGHGLRDFYDRASKIKSAGSRAFPGEDAFFLYDTRGLPFEIIEDLCKESELVVDEASFQIALDEQRDRSRRDYKDGKVRDQVAKIVYEEKTAFTGYDYREPSLAIVGAIVVDGELADAIDKGRQGEIVLEKTPFYAEAGGQVGDKGFLARGNSRACVLDTQYRGLTITHLVDVTEGRFEVGDEVHAEVDIDKRLLTNNNHTATHLLHAALKNILGPHVKQAGSLVAPDRLRFDFTHFASVSPSELHRIEEQVNKWIWRNVRVKTDVMDLDQAMGSGAVALFGEKYQDQVRVVEVPGFSKELCGGTHVPATGSIGLFKVISEGSVAAGVRRLEALTGPGAYSRLREDEDLLDRIQTEYKIGRNDLPATLDKLNGSLRDLQKELEDLKMKHARSGIDVLMRSVQEISGVKLLAHQMPAMDRGSMRALADELRGRLGSGIVILGAPQDGKVALVVMVTADIAPKIPAGKIIKEIAQIVAGSGGGKPELAEAGGKDLSKLADAIGAGPRIVQSLLGA